jgi:uncharacterized protein YcbK (DUF882 family)
MTSFKYFKREDFNCQHTGKNEMQDSFIRQLDEVREVCGFPFIVTSGYRDKTHPVEKIKKTPGTGKHCQGIAADIAVSGGAQRCQIVKHATALGFSVGVAKTFVHVDKRQTAQMVWCY